MAKKLAITIAGAVSLGSYESGVAFEILDAVSQHNQWADQNQAPGERIEIDVLTGASAGGMTVSMIAQRLLFDGAALSLPYDNPLYNAWVRDIDISGLLARQPDEPATHSLFSSDCVIEISKQYLTGRYASDPLPPPSPHPALSPDGNLQLGLALSNLNGVDYCRDTRSGGQFVYTDHEDQLLRPLNVQADDRPDIWEIIRGAAVACGAFPFAFRVEDLARNIVDYDSPFLMKELWGGNASRFFSYTDGGVFQNQPLGMAKNLVEMLPDGHLHALSRGYCFIAPQPKTSEQIPYTDDPSADPATAFGAAVADYKALLQRIALCVIGQASFQDWIMAEDVNEKIRLLDRRADQLQALFNNGSLTAAQTRPVSDAVLAQFFETPAAAANLEAARAQLRVQYAKEYADFVDHATAEAWLDSVLVLELAAGLHEKEEMLIYDFVADTSKLAGNGLDAFEGFFDVQYRKHDYDYGRSVAQQKLNDYQAQAGGIFSNLHWTPKPIDAIDPNLNQVDFSQVDQAKRVQVKSQIDSGVNALLQELNVDLAVRKVIEVAFIDGRVKKLLAL
ncbi:MAG TPA: patatin-like phospholipase family protein [Bryobacteraceae bacterium]|nr:patatin-like phospholipase family protein [Bryobacteraceae bacterium]